MSANIYWTPNKNTGTNLGVLAPSSFMEMFKEFYGDFPIILNKGDLKILQGMKYGTDNKNFKESLEDLLDAIDKHDEIKVFAIY